MPRYLTDKQLDRELLYVVRMHRGQDNAIGRWDLCIKLFGEDAVFSRSDTNTYDRNIRRCVERLRRRGYIICNLGNGDGYFLAVTKEDYQRFRAAYGAHAFPIMETIREMDKAAERQWPNPLQPSLM